jgi:hypothetical protein
MSFVNAADGTQQYHKTVGFFCRRLLAERKALKENAPMTDRLVAKAMAQHVEED